jgi:hypothetical protein
VISGRRVHQAPGAHDFPISWTEHEWPVGSTSARKALVIAAKADRGDADIMMKPFGGEFAVFIAPKDQRCVQLAGKVT